jgi:hypothetical protein
VGTAVVCIKESVVLATIAAVGEGWAVATACVRKRAMPMVIAE